MTRRSQLAVLAIALLAAAAAAAWWAWTSPSTLSPDEIFQNVEQGYRLLHGRGIVPWEYRLGLRSWILPGFLAAVMRAGELVLGTAHGHVIAVIGVLALGSLTVPWTAYATARSPVAGWSAVVAGVVCAAWVELLLFAPRPLTEVVATHALLPGLVLAQTGQTRGRLLAAGALLALTVALRLQLAPVAAIAAVWACRGRPDRWGWFLLGAAGPIALAGLVDVLSWGAPFHSAWKNFVVNLVEKKSEQYGVAPALAYLEAELRVWGWSALPLLALAVLGARRAPLLALSALVIVAVHSAIAHKEQRFIYPAIALVIVLAAAGTSMAIEQLRARRLPLAASALAALALWGGMSWDVTRRLDEKTVAVFPRDRIPGVPLWQVRRGPLLAFRHLAEGPTPCGIALVRVAWWETGGRSWLVHDSPLYEELVDGANDVVVTNVVGWNRRGWVKDRCFDNVCVLRRPGRCVPQPERQLELGMQRRGE